MGKIIETEFYRNTSSESVIEFITTGGGQWKEWDRFIAIDGKEAYHIGNICGTCEYFFERLDGANREIHCEEVIEYLNDGITKLSPDLIKSILKIIPNGNYSVNLIQSQCNMVELTSNEDYFANEQIEYWGLNNFWGLPHHPKIKYYRGESKKIYDIGNFCEFFVPMFPQNWLDDDRIEYYQEQIKLGKKPTAIAISILDIKQHFDSEIKHWCLTHYIIDGHHKMFSAWKENKEITFLSFLAVNKGVSTEKQVDELIKKLKSPC